MNKTLKLLGVSALAGGLLAAAVPADAAGPYTITAPSVGTSSFARRAFVQNGCQLSGAATTLNGTDARIIDVRAFAGRNVRLTWTAPVPANLGAALYTADCSTTGEAGTPAEFTTSGAVMKVSANATWLVAQAYKSANLSLTLTLV